MMLCSIFRRHLAFFILWNTILVRYSIPKIRCGKKYLPYSVQMKSSLKRREAKTVERYIINSLDVLANC